jgi:hypothetical protein
MNLRGILFRSVTMYYFLQTCAKYRVSPLNFLCLHYKHFKSGYTSKYELNKFIPRKYRLQTELLPFKYSCQKKKSSILSSFNFPIIVKPEWGFSSHGIQKVSNEIQLDYFLKITKNSEINYVCQEFCNYKKEYDIFYVAFEDKFQIISLTSVESPRVTGDGKSTIKELIKKSNLKNKNYLVETNRRDLSHILKCNEKRILTDKNSILHGTEYTNEEELLKGNYRKLIEHVESIKDFKINRISLKTNSFEDLLKGEFKIFELNILFPAPINALDTTLTSTQKREIIKSTMDPIVKIVQAHNKKSTMKQIWKFYNNNRNYVNKLKKLSKKC